MTKPVRTFSADVGDKSTGTAGPDYIENDIDNINKMFDPTQEGGGIGTENMQNGAVTDVKIANNAVIDEKIGNRTVNASITDAYANTGTLTQLLSWIVKTIKEMKGSVTNWYSSPADTLENLNIRVNSNDTDIANLQNNKADKSYVDTQDSSLQLQIDSNDTDIANLQNNKADKTDVYTKTELQTSGQAFVHWENLTNVPNLADNHWKSAVATYDDLPITGNSVDDMRVVANDGDGKSAMYRCYNAQDGLTIAEQWEKIADLDWTNDHGQLVGLADDDHPQYHNDSRGDLRYYKKEEVDTALSSKSDITHDHNSVYVARINGQFDSDIEFNQNQALNFVLQVLSDFPSNPVEGQKFYHSGLKREYVYKGTSGWTDTSGQGAICKKETFIASITGDEQFILTAGQYEVGTNTLVVFVNGDFVTVQEDDSTHFTVAVNAGDSVVAWWFENTPEVINQSVHADGTLQENLNADMVDGQHFTDIQTYTDTKVSDLAGAGRTTETVKGVADAVNAHLADTSNPHSVTKTDVGLGNVTNDLQATKTEFDAHLAESAIHKTSDVIRTETKTKLKVEVVSSSVSETPDAGRIIFDTSQGKFFGGNGTEWV